MKSIFTDEAHNEIINRLSHLEKDSKAKWGKMDVAQMVTHCQYPLNVILEKEDYNLKPNWLIKTFFKKAMYSDKPWKKNLPTVSRFKTEADKDFILEKPKLKKLIEELHSYKNRDDWQPHPVFGKMSKAQWGKMQYKHLDHHFRQFGV